MKLLLLLTLFSVFTQSAGPGRTLSEAQVWFNQAREHYVKQEWEKSRAAAIRALEINPQLAEAEVLLGLIATVQNQFPEAEKHFQKAVSLQPRNALAQGYLASTYLQQKRIAEAKSAFQKTLQLNPDNQAAKYNLGLIALRQQKPAEALSYFEKVRRADPSDVSALIGILESQLLLKQHSMAHRSVHQLASILTPQDPRLFQVATLLAFHQDYTTAIPLLEQVRQAFPKSYDANYNLALAYFRTDNYEKTAEILKSLLNQAQRAEAYNLLASVQEKRQLHDEALQGFQKAVELEPGNEDYQFDYANQLLQMDNNQATITAFTSAVDRFPKSWRMRLGLGVAYYLSGKYEQATQSLLAAAHLEPQAKLVYSLLGRIYESAESSQPAIYEALKTYCEQNPDDPWAYFHYGTILYLRAEADSHPDFQKARLFLNRAIAQNPNLAEAELQLGVIAQSEGRWEEGIQFLEKAIRMNPNLDTAHYRLGLAYQRAGEKDKAQAEFQLFEKLKLESHASQEKRTVVQYLSEQRK